MQLAGPVVVENLREDARMSVEEVLVEYWVVVGQCLGETGQPGGRDLLQRRLVRLVTDPTDVEDHTVLGIRHHRRRHHLCRDVIIFVVTSSQSHDVADVTPLRACVVNYFRSGCDDDDDDGDRGWQLKGSRQYGCRRWRGDGQTNQRMNGRTDGGWRMDG